MVHPPVRAAGWEDLDDHGAYAQNRSGVMWWDGLERLLHPFSWVGEVIKGNDAGTVLVGRGGPSVSASRLAFRWTAADDTCVIDLGTADIAFNPTGGRAVYLL
jgi:hypothetical protein